MIKQKRKSFPDKYRALFIATISVLLLNSGYGQVYNPSLHIIANDAIGFSQATPGDGRSMFWDASFFKWRDYASTTEVLTTLPNLANRFGHYPIYIHMGGSLSGGVWTGGITQVWFFKNGTADSNLVRWFTDSTTSTGGITQLTNDVLAGPGSGIVAASLAVVNPNVGLFGNAANVVQANYDAKGRVTSPVLVPIQIAEAQVTGLASDLAAKISNITGLVQQGANISITGFGTSGSPYVINSAGGISQLKSQANTPLSIGGVDTVRFNNNAIRRVLNVMDFGADSTFTNDCTAAIQAAIDRAFAMGGGVVYFPKGHYKISGALNTTGIGNTVNCQICIPLTGPAYPNAPLIVLEGEKIPSMEQGILFTGYTPVVDGGSILESTIVGSGLRPSIFGARDTIFNISDTFTATEVQMKNLYIKTNTKAANGTTDTVGSMSAINFRQVTACMIENVRIDISSPLATSLQPNNTFGIYMPAEDNSAWSTVRNTMISGHFSGIVVSEHTYLDYVTFQACFDAISSQGGPHDWGTGRVLVNGCVNGIHIVKSSKFKVSDYDAEHYTGNQGPRWYEFNCDLYSDQINLAMGSINHNIVVSGGVSSPIFRTINTNLQNVAISPITQAPLSSFTVVGSSNKSVFGSIVQPNATVFEIGSDSIGSPTQFNMTNVLTGGGQFFGSIGIGNKASGKQLYSNNLTTLINRTGFKTQESYSSYLDSTLKVNLTRTPFNFALGVPLNLAAFTAAVPPVTEVIPGTLWWDSDSNRVRVRVPPGTSFKYFAYTSDVTVASVSNADGTLLISPTTGAVVASLNLAHANTFSALQTFGTLTTTSTTIMSGLVGAGGTDSLVTIDPTTGQLKRQSPGMIRYRHTIFTPLTAGTVNLVNNQYNIINPAGTIATLTVALPSSPANNDVVYIKYDQAVTLVTYTNGTVNGAITVPGAGQLVVLTFDSGTNQWY